MENAGGCERVASILSNSFFKQGYSVNIVTLYGEKSFYHLDNGVNLVSLKKIPFLKKSFELYKMLEKDNANIIIGIGMGRLNPWLAVHFFLFNKKAKLILAEHINFTSYTYWQKKLRAILFKYAFGIVVLTESNKEKLLMCGLKNVVVIPNISSFPILEETFFDNRERIILAVGRLERQKNFSNLINIWNNIYSKYPSWKLIIIGEGSEFDKLNKLIERLDISQEQCIIFPFQKDIRQFYMKAQILAMTSFYEGLPMTLIEAMSTGCPCISYDCETGPRDIIVDNYTGFLVSYLDSFEFQNKLEILVNNIEIRKQFSLNSLREAERFSSEEILKKWDDILQRTNFV
jgi:amylovoran biosynthesis glycosyltransferase AmsD